MASVSASRWLRKQRQFPGVPCDNLGFARFVRRRSCANNWLDSSIPQLVDALFNNAECISPTILLLLGGPGAGKGTVSAQLASRHGWNWVSAGQVLRNAAAKDASIAHVLAQGSVVPSEVSTRAVLQHLKDHTNHIGYPSLTTGPSATIASMQNRWIIDGFPRNLEGAALWEKCGGKVWRVLALEVQNDECIRHRLRLRGRSDDTDPQVLHARLTQHKQEWPRLRSFYETRGLWHAVDATGGVDNVWRRVDEWLADQPAV